ncbi:hypothetical protein [Chryseobacterium taklimakanense]|jgi:hypothetical protein|nr:hypothetical protein [Chryseobacterium taklimakanense]
MVKVLTNNVLSGFGRKQQQGDKIGGDILSINAASALLLLFFFLVNIIN